MHLWVLLLQSLLFHLMEAKSQIEFHLKISTLKLSPKNPSRTDHLSIPADPTVSEIASLQLAP